MKVKSKKLLENRYLLYLVFFIALVTLFGFVSTNNFSAVLLFILIGILTSYFSKNMIVILASCIVGSHLINLVNTNSNTVKPYNTIEGFKEGNSNSGTDDKYEEEDKESFEVKEPVKTKKGKAKKAGFTNQSLNPATFDNTPSLESIMSKTDTAKQKEKAFDLLETKMNDESVKNIAGNTKNLLGKQVELMDQMKKITPILQQTMGLVNNLDLSSLTDMAEKVTKLMPDDLGNLSSSLANN